MHPGTQSTQRQSHTFAHKSIYLSQTYTCTIKTCTYFIRLLYMLEYSHRASWVRYTHTELPHPPLQPFPLLGAPANKAVSPHPLPTVLWGLWGLPLECVWGKREGAGLALLMWQHSSPAAWATPSTGKGLKEQDAQV